jgi:Ni,Fe-hydrogenase III large subunit
MDMESNSSLILPTLNAFHPTICWPRSQITHYDFETFRSLAFARMQQGDQVPVWFGMPCGTQRAQLVMVLANAAKHELRMLCTEAQTQYPALTPLAAQLHAFECEIAEQCHILPQDHPHLAPVRGPHAEPGGFRAAAQPEFHEICVGPIHGGVTEAGRYRLSCRGERIASANIELGFQHRGIERKLIGGPNGRSLHYMESIAGESVIAHTLAYCEVLESLSGTLLSPRAEVLRGIALELERLMLHTRDLGLLAQLAGYPPSAVACVRLRERFANLMLFWCGHRSGHGLIRPGGVYYDLTANQVSELTQQFLEIASQMEKVVHELWLSATIRQRFACGPISNEQAKQAGLVGLLARASGVEHDIRRDHPRGIYRQTPWPVVATTGGDTLARAQVRCLEMEHSLAWIRQQLPQLPAGEIKKPLLPLAAEACAVSLVEGAQGQLCHVAMTDQAGQFHHYKIVDPAFYNWTGLSCAVRNQAISDFPLILQSCGLSHAGHDL